MITGKWKGDKETWWWDKEAQEVISEKKQAKKKWNEVNDQQSQDEFRIANKKRKKVVLKA